MRILVVGAGGVGGFFGAKLAAAGRDVTYLVRPARAATLAADGLRIRPFRADEFVVDVKTVTAEQLAAAGPAAGSGAASIGAPAEEASGASATTAAGAGAGFDLVLLSVKAYTLDQALDDLAPAIRPNTLILPLLNGIRHIDVLRERFGAEHVIGGLCRISVQLDDDGAIRQVGPGAAMAYGEFDGSLSERMHEVDASLAGADFSTTLSTRVEHDLWEKWMMLASGGALTTLLRAPIGEIVAVPGGAHAAESILGEAFAVATAAGFAPSEGARERLTGILTEPGSLFATSMYRDLTQGRAVEAEQIVGDLARRGRASGVDVTWLELAYTGLCVYQNSLGA
ncbi:2-dehydropantoate 2-reductase [Subtercola lobariae]|uniref:2-dehydropantoate 2-reductase n=1 Tax=Subtercola lobariae TaxID=1588641 RepID=A0A917F2T2_9MICO|nr:2-dehydropantoate 2-reductase [Subtercola lobariae]GGF37423.1 2-dehydropantoate 2-reductase [Subtercola lobariae]